MRQATYLAVPMLVIIAGCGEGAASLNRNTTPGVESSSGAPQSQGIAPPTISIGAKPIPNNVTYTIIDKHIVPGIKRSLEIRLNRKVTKDVLTAIAMKLKNADSNTYDKTFIGYYLPGMQANTGCWAITHFNPNLQVRIFGLTTEQEQSLEQRITDLSRETIGTWLNESPFITGRITIFRKDGKLFVEKIYKNGSERTSELAETPTQHGRRFDFIPDRGDGEHFLINSKGELQQLDPDGLFMTAQKVN